MKKFLKWIFKLNFESDVVIGGKYVHETDYGNPYNTLFYYPIECKNGFVLYKYGNNGMTSSQDINSFCTFKYLIK